MYPNLSHEMVSILQFTFCVFQVDSESLIVGKAAIGNMLGGIGYFYGQSKISLPKNNNVSYLNLFLCCWLSLKVAYHLFDMTVIH